MRNCKYLTFGFQMALFYKRNSLILFIAVTKVDISPNSFDVSVSSLLEDIWVLCFIVSCDESIASLA